MWVELECCCSHRTDGLVALLDDVLQLSQHCHLGVLQLQLLRGSIRYTGLVGGLGFICLHTRKADCEHTQSVTELTKRLHPEIQPESSQISLESSELHN